MVGGTDDSLRHQSIDLKYSWMALYSLEFFYCSLNSFMCVKPSEVPSDILHLNKFVFHFLFIMTWKHLHNFSLNWTWLNGQFWWNPMLLKWQNYEINIFSTIEFFWLYFMFKDFFRDFYSVCANLWTVHCAEWKYQLRLLP